MSSTKFSQKELESIKKLFNEKDKDKSGYLTVDEILMMMRENDTSITMQEAKAYLESMDLNGDGKVSIEEYIAHLESTME